MCLYVGIRHNLTVLCNVYCATLTQLTQDLTENVIANQSVSCDMSS